MNHNQTIIFITLLFFCFCFFDDASGKKFSIKEETKRNILGGRLPHVHGGLDEFRLEHQHETMTKTRRSSQDENESNFDFVLSNSIHAMRDDGRNISLSYELHGKDDGPTILSADETPQILKINCTLETELTVFLDASFGTADFEKWAEGVIITGGYHWGCKKSRKMIKDKDGNSMEENVENHHNFHRSSKAPLRHRILSTPRWKRRTVKSFDGEDVEVFIGEMDASRVEVYDIFPKGRVEITTNTMHEITERYTKYMSYEISFNYDENQRRSVYSLDVTPLLDLQTDVSAICSNCYYYLFPQLTFIIEWDYWITKLEARLDGEAAAGFELYLQSERNRMQGNFEGLVWSKSLGFIGVSVPFLGEFGLKPESRVYGGVDVDISGKFAGQVGTSAFLDVCLGGRVTSSGITNPCGDLDSNSLDIKTKPLVLDNPVGVTVTPYIRAAIWLGILDDDSGVEVGFKASTPLYGTLSTGSCQGGNSGYNLPWEGNFNLDIILTSQIATDLFTFSYFDTIALTLFSSPSFISGCLDIGKGAPYYRTPYAQPIFLTMFESNQYFNDGGYEEFVFSCESSGEFDNGDVTLQGRYWDEVRYNEEHFVGWIIDSHNNIYCRFYEDDMLYDDPLTSCTHSKSDLIDSYFTCYAKADPDSSYDDYSKYGHNYFHRARVAMHSTMKSKVPSSWTCSNSAYAEQFIDSTYSYDDDIYFASGSCDTGCGAFDPDCEDPRANANRKTGCGSGKVISLEDGSCNDWTCSKEWFGGLDGCDLNCGEVQDPDCFVPGQAKLNGELTWDIDCRKYKGGWGCKWFPHASAMAYEVQYSVNGGGKWKTVPGKQPQTLNYFIVRSGVIKGTMEVNIRVRPLYHWGEYGEYLYSNNLLTAY